MRQIVLDTETTGLDVTQGHRMIEIGCIELIDRKFTGQHFHTYLNPEREIDPGASAVHGIKNEFLKDKPIFAHIVKDFMSFIQGAELIIHNAPFDIGFINHEIQCLQQEWQPITHYCHVIDTLALARRMFMGQRNSLDALCKRYNIDNSKREFHGALLDAHLLAQIYLLMTGGQGSFFDTLSETEITVGKKAVHNTESLVINKKPLPVIKADEKELSEHQNYLRTLKKHGICLWDEV